MCLRGLRRVPCACLSLRWVSSFVCIWCRSYLPDAFVCCVFQVVVCPARDWYQRPCLRDEAVYLFLYNDDELSAVGGLECVCRFYFLCVAGVVFGVKQSVDRVRAHDVRVGQCVIIVIGGKDSWWGVFAVHDCAE